MRPSDPEERKRRANRFRERKREANRRYEERRKAKVIAGELPWNSLPAVNPERRKRRMSEGRVYGPYHRFTESHECIGRGHPNHVCRFFPDEGRDGIEGDHVTTVAAGGVDYANEYPACPGLHNLRHTEGISAVEKLLGIRIEEPVERIREAWDALNDEEQEAWT